MVDIPGYLHYFLHMSGLPVISSLIPAVRFSPLEKRTAGICMDYKGHHVLSQHIHHVGLSRDIPHILGLSWDIPVLVGISRDIPVLVGISRKFHIFIGISQDLQVFVGISQVTRWLMAHVRSGPRRARAAGHHVRTRAGSYTNFQHA